MNRSFTGYRVAKFYRKETSWESTPVANFRIQYIAVFSDGITPRSGGVIPAQIPDQF
jgi:hypothetical protein